MKSKINIIKSKIAEFKDVIQELNTLIKEVNNPELIEMSTEFNNLFEISMKELLYYIKILEDE